MTRLLHVIEAWLVGGWFGSWALFAVVVAPTAFGVLPGDAAGRMVGPVLRSLHLYGLGAGIALFAIAFALRRGQWPMLLPAILAALCAVTEFGVSAAIAEVRPSTYAPNTPGGAAADFSRLHMTSRVLFMTVLIGAAALLAMHSGRRGTGPHSDQEAD